MQAYAQALEAQRAHAWALAVTDSLTGLANRRRFEAVLQREVRRSSRYGRPVALLMLDVDDFKGLNDHWGHAAGDAALCQLAATLRGAARAEDLPARVGGDEFAVLLPETTPADAAVAAAERASAASPALRVSIGVASLAVPRAPWAPAAAAATLLWEAADRNLYGVKQRRSGGRARGADGPRAMSDG